MRAPAYPLLLLIACGCGASDITRPKYDAALEKTPQGTAEIDFDQAKPELVPAHHAQLLLGFEGVDRNCLPDEMQQEIRAWEQERIRANRAVRPAQLPNHVPQDWKPAHEWYAGGMQGSTQLCEVTLAGTTYAIGATLLPGQESPDGLPAADQRVPRHSSLAWTSSAAPTTMNWIEHAVALPETASMMRFDLARHGSELVVVCESQDGLREYTFEARDGQLVEKRRRKLASEKAFGPVLLEFGAEVVLLCAEYRAESSRRLQGGCALLLSRLAAGATQWSEPHALTIDLQSGPAACVHGEQLTVAWNDDRYRRLHLSGTSNGGKTMIATSGDRGVTWTKPVLLHDPGDEQDWNIGGLYVFDDGARILLLTPNAEPRETPAGLVVGGYVLSRDLARWAPGGASRQQQLANWCREKITGRPR